MRTESGVEDEEEESDSKLLTAGPSKRKFSLVVREIEINDSRVSCKSEKQERSVVKLAITPADAEDIRSPFLSKGKCTDGEESSNSHSRVAAAKRQEKPKTSANAKKRIAQPLSAKSNANLPRSHYDKKRQRSFCESTALRTKSTRRVRDTGGNVRDGDVSTPNSANSRLVSARRLLESFRDRQRSNDRQASVENGMKASDSERSVNRRKSGCGADGRERPRLKIRPMFLKPGNF